MEPHFTMSAAGPQVHAPEAKLTRFDSFRSQTPLAILAFCAVAAIVMVNRPAAPAATAPVYLTPDAADEAQPSCARCGQIVSVQLVSLHPDTAPTIKTFELIVRMDDGTLRTLRQFAPVFDIGDRVRLNHGTLAARG